ncbi:MAG: hypothetical protein KDB53_12435 [Planctomycetes bacterium]|nr:hypothetical protein [Planctomycetota bacterium]
MTILRLACFMLLALSVAAQQGLVDQYHFDGTRPLPADPGGAGQSFDVLPDGRLIVATGLQIQVELAPESGTWTTLGTLSGPVPQFGTAFLRVSPTGQRFAIGDNGGRVGVFDVGNLAGVWLTAAHFDAAWFDQDTLAITDFGVVTMLEVDDPNPLSPANPVVISGIGGASGGIAFDAQGRLYTANGFQTSGPSATGDIKVFEAAAWLAAASSGLPIDFESAGQFLGNVLSGTSLGFDARGNLFVGGGAAFGGGGSGYAALLSAGALAAARSNQVSLNPNAAVRALQLDPDPAAGSFYGLLHDAASGSVLLSAFGQGQLWVYRSSARPGHGDDFALRVELNATPIAAAVAATALVSGDLVQLELDTPHAALVSGLPFVFAQYYLQATGLVASGLPSFHLDLTGSTTHPLIVFHAPALLTAAPQVYGFVVPPVAASLGLRVQALTLSPGALNGSYALSNAFDFSY